MAFIAPPPPEELLKLLKGQGAVQQPGAPMFGARPGMPGIGAPPPAISGGLPAAVTAAASGAPAQPIQPVPSPAPSDDPAVSSMGTIPQVPDFGEFIRQGMARRQAAEDKMSALKPPLPQDYKPSIKRRLASMLVGAAGRFADPEAGAAEQSNFLNAPFNRARAQYSAQAAPIQKELDETKADVPMYTAAGEAAYHQFQGNMDVAKEGRERFTARSNADYKQDLNEIRQNIAADKIDEAQKKLDETAERNKNNAEVQDRIATLREELAKARIEKEEKGKDHSAQFRTVASQKASAITKANAKHDKAVSELAPNDVKGHQEAQAELMRDLQEAQDAYEEGITTLGGSAEHQEVTPSGWKKSGVQPESEAKPIAQQSQQEVKSLNGHSVGQVVKLKDGSSVKITKMYADGRFEHELAK